MQKIENFYEDIKLNSTIANFELQLCVFNVHGKIVWKGENVNCSHLWKVKLWVFYLYI